MRKITYSSASFCDIQEPKVQLDRSGRVNAAHGAALGDHPSVKSACPGELVSESSRPIHGAHQATGVDVLPNYQCGQAATRRAGGSLLHLIIQKGGGS